MTASLSRRFRFATVARVHGKYARPPPCVRDVYWNCCVRVRVYMCISDRHCTRPIQYASRTQGGHLAYLSCTRARSEPKVVPIWVGKFNHSTTVRILNLLPNTFLELHDGLLQCYRCAFDCYPAPAFACCNSHPRKGPHPARPRQPQIHFGRLRLKAQKDRF